MNLRARIKSSVPFSCQNCPWHGTPTALPKQFSRVWNVRVDRGLLPTGSAGADTLLLTVTDFRSIDMGSPVPPGLRVRNESQSLTNHRNNFFILSDFSIHSA